jgi:hypothetical protein
MSYDLFFRPRSSAVSGEAFLNHFRERPHYKVENGQAWYQNEDTGVYFAFEHGDAGESDEPQEPFSFNINFFRPSYFILEAEPEVSALVGRFDFLVSDTQAPGMGDGEYVPQLLISGWQHGNEFGYSALLTDKEQRPDVASLPAARLHEVWRWNLAREALQKSVGEAQFVPVIMFLRLNETLVTAVVWPDGIPSVLPEVDYLIIQREDLAPRRLFRRSKHTVFVPWADVHPHIASYHSRNDGVFDLNYVKCPQEIAAFIRSLDREEPAITGVTADQVLDRELVEKYAI